jgi:hypothetical protein
LRRPIARSKPSDFGGAGGGRWPSSRCRHGAEQCVRFRVIRAIDNRFDFYADEDTARIDRDCLGIPILAPADIPSESTIFVCLKKKLAADIAARYSDPGRHFVVPPRVAI